MYTMRLSLMSRSRCVMRDCEYANPPLASCTSHTCVRHTTPELRVKTWLHLKRFNVETVVVLSRFASFVGSVI